MLGRYVEAIARCGDRQRAWQCPRDVAHVQVDFWKHFPKWQTAFCAWAITTLHFRASRRVPQRTPPTASTPSALHPVTPYILSSRSIASDLRDHHGVRQPYDGARTFPQWRCTSDPRLTRRTRVRSTSRHGGAAQSSCELLLKPLLRSHLRTAMRPMRATREGTRSTSLPSSSRLRETLQKLERAMKNRRTSVWVCRLTANRKHHKACQQSAHLLRTWSYHSRGSRPSTDPPKMLPRAMMSKRYPGREDDLNARLDQRRA